MKNLLKKFTLFLAAAIAVTCVCALAACKNDNDENKDSYTITVKYPDGTAVNGQELGLTVQICEYIIAEERIGTCYGTYNVGADGKAAVPADAFWDLKNNTKYHWQVNNLPDKYTYSEESVLMDAPGDLTITLVAKNG